jgi:hypothetical protein
LLLVQRRFESLTGPAASLVFALIRLVNWRLWLLLAVTVGFLEQRLVAGDFPLQVLLDVLHALLEMHFCNYAGLAPISSERRFPCVAACTSFLPFVSQ